MQHKQNYGLRIKKMVGRCEQDREDGKKSERGVFLRSYWQIKFGPKSNELFRNVKLWERSNAAVNLLQVKHISSADGVKVVTTYSYIFQNAVAFSKLLYHHLENQAALYLYCTYDFKFGMALHSTYYKQKCSTNGTRYTL